jgi:hypothetical protein
VRVCAKGGSHRWIGNAVLRPARATTILGLLPSLCDTAPGLSAGGAMLCNRSLIHASDASTWRFWCRHLVIRLLQRIEPTPTQGCCLAGRGSAVMSCSHGSTAVRNGRYDGMDEHELWDKQTGCADCIGGCQSSRNACQAPSNRGSPDPNGRANTKRPPRRAPSID